MEPDDSIIHQKILDSINASGNPILPTFHMPTLQVSLNPSALLQAAAKTLLCPTSIEG